MFPSRSRKSESRRSSILKPRKPRQPLQNVNFDSSSNESSPTATKTKRRVSFAEIKHVKEFCHSTEQGTVWDNTYEEHDSSLKSSFADQNAEVELKENAPCAPDNDSVHIHSENSSYYSNNVCLINNQPSQSIARGSEEDNDTDCDLDFTNPVKSTELLNASQLECATLPNKSLTVSKDAASSGIVEYSDTAEECMESQPRQTVITSISHISKNEESNCIAVYRDFDEEIYADNVAKYNSKSCPNNINSQLDETHIQDLSMDLTEPIPVFLLSYVKEQKKQKRNDINILDTNYTTVCHNASMEMTEAVPIFAEPVASDLGISKQIPTILQNCESTKWDAASTCNTTGVNYANDSMILTSVIQPFKDTDICHTNNTGFDTSMEMINVPSKMYKKNACNENVVKENDLRKDQTDKTEIFNDVPMEMTRPVNILFPNVYNKENFRMDEPSSDDRTMFFHNVSMEMTKAVSTKNKQEIGNTNTCRLLSEENAHGKDVNTSICFNEGTRVLCKSIEFTETVPGPLCYETTSHNVHVTQFVNKSTCENHKKDGTEFSNNASIEITKSVNMLPLSINKKNLKIDESKDGKTMFFHNVSMEMTTAVSSRNRNEITQPVTCKSMFKENTYGGKDSRLLCKSMEFTEVIPNSLHDERTFDTPATQSSQTLSKTTLLPAENSVRVTDTVTNETVEDVSVEIITAVPSILQLKKDVKLNEYKENTYKEKNTNNSTCFDERTKLLCKSMEFTEVVPISLHDERTFNTTSATQSSQTLSKTTLLPAENSVRVTDAVTNKTLQDVSMEITTAVPSILQLKKDVKLNEYKENTYKEKNTNNSTCFDERTKLLCKSMEFTEVVPISLHDERTFNTTSATQSSQTLSKTTLLPAENSVRVTDAVTNKTLQDVSMEITTAVPSILQLKKDVKLNEYKENTYKEKNTNNSTCFDERTKLLCKSMEFTEVVPISLHDERTFNTTSATQSSQTLSKTTLLPAENSVRVTDAVTNKTLQDVSMEITTAVPSILQLKKDVKLNEYKENTYKEKNTNNSTCFDERTKLLCKSMEFTEVVPISLHDERTFNTTSATQSSQTLSKTTLLPAENSVRVTDAVTNKTVQDVSMEITTAVPSILQLKKDVKLNEYKENTYKEKNTNNSTCFDERTRLLCKSMEFTEVVPNSLHDERTFNTTPTTQSSQILSKTILPAENSVKVPDVVTNKTVQDVSMEITTAVPSILQLIQDEKLNEFKENTYKEKDTINSTCFNEKTRLLCKSMEFSEVVPISLHDERTFNTAHTIQSSQTLSETTSLPVENSMRITDAVTNKTIQDVSMEITTAVPSILQLVQDEKLNETENSIILKNDEFQHLTTNNLTKSNRNTAKENSTISREIVETENIRHNELSNIIVTQSSLDNLDHSLNANFKNGSDKKRRSDASEESYSKRVRTSMEIQSFQENDIHPFPNANTNCTNDIERPEYFVKDVVDHTQVSDSNFVNEIEYNERFIKDTMDHTQEPDSNLRDSLSEINKDSFLRKSLPYLENSFVELQSIKPPSFVCLDNEEENSREIQNELQSLIITDTVNNTSNQLINNLTESKCLKEKVINIENNQVEDCHRNLIVDKTEDNQETNYQTGIKTLINDNQSDKSNYCTKKNISKENISMNEKTLTVQDINHCTSLIIRELKNTIEIDDDTDEDQVNEGEHTHKSTNEDIKLQSDIKEKEQYSDKKNQEIKQCSDHFEGTEEVIEEIDSEERRINLNDEVQQQSIEQKNECAIKRLETAQHISTIEDVRNESLIEQDPFLILSQKLETHGARDDCIWDIYYKNIDRKMIVFGFMSNSLLIATFLSHDLNSSEENLIREVKIISRISDDAGVLIRIVHKLILQKLNAEILTKLYKTHQDILPMLNFISQDVKLAMDFMFDLRRLDDLNLMDIDHDEISFVSRSKRMDIILRVTIKVKQFDKLTSNDISLRCLLGRIKETDIKNLIKNVKRDHKFLRRYMNDVKDYIDIIEETSNNLMTE